MEQNHFCIPDSKTNMDHILPDLLLQIAHFNGWNNTGRLQCVCQHWHKALDVVATFCCTKPCGGSILKMLQRIVHAKHIHLQDQSTHDTQWYKETFFGAALNTLSSVGAAGVSSEPLSLSIQWRHGLHNLDASWLLLMLTQHMEHDACRLEELELDFLPLACCRSVDVMERFAAAVKRAHTLRRLTFLMRCTPSLVLMKFAFFGGCIRSFTVALNEHTEASKQLFRTVDDHFDKCVDRHSVLTHLHLNLYKVVSNIHAVFRWLTHLNRLLALRMSISNVDLGNVCNQFIMAEATGAMHLKRLHLQCQKTSMTPAALVWLLCGFKKIA